VSNSQQGMRSNLGHEAKLKRSVRSNGCSSEAHVPCCLQPNHPRQQLRHATGWNDACTEVHAGAWGA
jgi:hypothetical protein